MKVLSPQSNEGPEQGGRRRRLRSLSFAPTLLTLGNLTCGFAAIHFALRTMYELGVGGSEAAISSLPPRLLERMLPSLLSMGGGLVILGMVFDMFDGLVARVTRSTTNFGGQLDSLADVVTFGVAPATLMVVFMTKCLGPDAIIPSPLSEHFWGRFTWVCAALYVAMGAVRLARYNVEHADVNFDHRTFRGLPIPGAAGVMVALILFQDLMGDTAKSVIGYAMPIVALLTALLMVSRIPYKRIHRTYLVGRRPFSQVVIGILFFAILLSQPAVTLLVLVLGYGASGPIAYALRRLRDRKLLPGAARQDAVDTTDATDATRKEA